MNNPPFIIFTAYTIGMLITWVRPYWATKLTYKWSDFFEDLLEDNPHLDALPPDVQSRVLTGGRVLICLFWPAYVIKDIVKTIQEIKKED